MQYTRHTIQYIEIWNKSLELLNNQSPGVYAREMVGKSIYDRAEYWPTRINLKTNIAIASRDGEPEPYLLFGIGTGAGTTG